ncbi:Cof-type HAD-IIB family hydrolase [Chengkuizengella axinellae]|uniref:Cof-type HAD-IIB family hydrolase n=1 Tax=Chengkuizengella axinellae TaxID=3064388 RepID=A0ABT9IT75_9BACL|nr:Cof-type HAD-IIB family hydrolase [Chengkuizengella sp. 2205SS18-9]MDP5272559.1 Cof-type HAD-IIB family hydrolase [Chengkuizengella sp. 2205SS18-9]
MGNNYKLIALDMDGTVLNEKDKISSANQAAIRKAIEHKVLVCFATGRVYQDIEPFLQELNLDTPIIASNGGEVWKNPNEVYQRHCIDEKIIKELREIAIYNNCWFKGRAVEGVFSREQWIEDDISANQWLSFVFFTDEDNKRKQIFEKINAWGTLEITNSHPYNLEINPRGISKASGIREICKWKNFEMSEVIAMGDSLNDLAMICEAGLGVAMGNAQDEVKQKADIVTLTNDEDGVAKIIENYI